MSDSRGRLLEEQNAAYEASMLADQEKVSEIISFVEDISSIVRSTIQAAQRMREENERRLVEEEQQRKLQVIISSLSFHFELRLIRRSLIFVRI